MAFEFSDHDHAQCCKSGVDRANRICEDRGLRLTAIRRRVLELLLAEHRAYGAYDILDQLRVEGMGSQPPVVYRALDFLVAHGFAHRIESLNAFIACSSPDNSHSPVFMICDSCKSVAEMPSAPIRSHLGDLAAESGFAIRTTQIEALGQCPNCEAPQ